MAFGGYPKYGRNNPRNHPVYKRRAAYRAARRKVNRGAYTAYRGSALARAMGRLYKGGYGRTRHPSYKRWS